MKRDTFERLKKMGIDFDDDFENLMVKPLKKQSEKIEEEKGEDVDRYDFLPIVKVNNSEDAKNAIISVKENKTYKKEQIDLGTDYDKDKSDYLVADIVITQNSVARIPLMVKRGFDPWGLQDDDGVLTFECSNSSVKLKFIDKEDTDYNDTAKEYNLNKAANGDVFVMEITPSSIKRGTKFTITVYATDNNDWTRNKSLRRGICGKFNLKVVEQDVFMEDEITKLVDELKYIKPFADGYSPLEYEGNYCMAAAERGLSELLNNTKDFYSVFRRTHKRKNKISFSNLTADDRAKKFQALNFVASKISFPTKDFSITLNKTFIIEDGKHKDRTTIVEMKDIKSVYDSFLKNFNKSIGYHIYYCSIAGANHTMILIINYTEPSEATFEFWDQHGISSSRGKLENIANGDNGVDGINAQVQWLVRWLRGVKKTQGSHNADSFYPQLTCNFYKIKR